MTEARRTLAAALLVVVLALILFAIHPAFFVKDDFQLQYLPGSREVARAWTSGDWPLLSRYSWVCAPLAAEYQFGVFSIFRALLDVLVWALPFSLTGRGAFLFIVHAAIAAAGAFRLARSYGATPGGAAMVAIVAALNGWMLWWATTWYPAIASFAWLPWYWLALRTVDRRWSWLLASISLYLLVAAGWPYSVAMAAAVAAMHFLTALVQRRWRAALTMTWASVLGLALAAPAVLMLLEYFPYTARESAVALVESMWFIPPRALFGLVIPAFTTAWPVFTGSLPHPAVELLGAFVPLTIMLAAMRRDFARRHMPELLLLISLLILMLLPSAGPFRWSFRWLPLFHLALALVASAGLPSTGRRAPLFGLALVGITAIASLTFGLEPQAALLHAAIVGALCGLWLIVDRGVMPAAVTVAVILLTFATFSKRGEVPVWSYDDALLSPGVLDPSRRYLAMVEFEETVAEDAHGRYTVGRGAELRPGNIPMLAGVEFINGYSPLGLAALRNLFDVDVHGPMHGERAEIFLRYETGQNELLHQLGVDGLVVPEVMARRHAVVLAKNGWVPAARFGSALVLHRPPIVSPLFSAAIAVKTANERQAYSAIFERKTPQLPVVLFTAGNGAVEHYWPRRLTEVEEGRNHTSFVVSGKGPRALVVFRRPWLPGWRATIDGRTLPVLRANMVMPAVEIPADSLGEVRLVYRPASLVAITRNLPSTGSLTASPRRPPG